MRSIKQEILRGGAERLKTYLRSRLEPGAEPGAAEAAADGLALDLRDAGASGELSLEGKGLAALPPLPPGLRVLHLARNALVAQALDTTLADRLADGTGIG